MTKIDAKKIDKSKKRTNCGKKTGFFNTVLGTIRKLCGKSFQQFLLKIAFVIIAVGMGISILEVGARLLEKKAYGLAKCTSLDQNFHHVMIPKSVCRFKTDEWDTMYMINSLGLRGNEVDIEKPINTFRIWVIGDSFVQGHGVDFEKSFASVLEKKLNDNKLENNVEIVTSGVYGYSPLVEYLYLKEKAIDFKPDLVLLTVNPTDFFEDRQRLAELRLSNPGLDDEKIEELIRNGKVKFKFDLINSSPATPQKILLPGISYRVKTWLKEHLKTYSALVDFVKKKNKSNVQQDTLNQGDIDRDILAIERGNKISDENWQTLWELPIQHIEMMKNLLDENNISFIIVAIPDAMQVSDDEWSGRKLLGFANHYIDTRPPYEEELAKRLENINVPVINLLSSFKDSNIFPLYFKNDGHWRESGHKLAADVVFRYLKEAGMIR